MQVVSVNGMYDSLTEWRNFLCFSLDRLDGFICVRSDFVKGSLKCKQLQLTEFYISLKALVEKFSLISLDGWENFKK